LEKIAGEEEGSFANNEFNNFEVLEQFNSENNERVNVACPNCGFILKEDSKFCTNCGSEINLELLFYKNNICKNLNLVETISKFRLTSNLFAWFSKISYICNYF